MVDDQRPIFRAYQSSFQSIASGVWTKLQFQSKSFDTFDYFDTGPNFRFTTKIPGYYQINGAVQLALTAGQASLALAIYKNGVVYAQTATSTSATTVSPSAFISDIIYLNSSEYVELFIRHYIGSNVAPAASSNLTYMSGANLI